jgi:single-strand DNA-binding protein
VEGSLKTREWEDKDGNQRYSTEIHADRVDFLGGDTSNAGGDGAMSQPDPAPEPTSQERTSQDQDAFEPDDDLPF